MSKFTKAVSRGVAAMERVDDVICQDCGTVGQPKKRIKGSLLVEFLLWCMMILPGLVYSIWRLTTKAKVCRACGSEALVPVGTPRGRLLVQQFSAAAK
jgi:ribosomal protein L40E